MEKFNCEMCGYCCSKFAEGYLPVFPWEAEVLREKAKEISKDKKLRKKIQLNLKPVYVMKDSVSGIKFFPFYGMFNEPCPFVKKEKGSNKNKCSIHKDRPLICRMFPLYKSPFASYSNSNTSLESKGINKSLFYYCPNNSVKISNFVEEVKLLSKNIQSEKYNEVFGECFEAMNEWIKIKTFIDSSVKDLMGKEKIVLEKGHYNSDEIRNVDIENKKDLISVFEFLEKFK